MKFTTVEKQHWKTIKTLYLEAFPKQERKPFFVLRHCIKSGKGQLFIALEKELLLGFILAIPYENMVMVDYLAVSANSRNKGTGSFLLNQLCRQFPDKKILLLIERLDETAANAQQRIARRRFYLKNGFISSQLFTTGAGGDMEILCYGETVSGEDYLRLQKYALGNLFFRLSKIKLV
ncbi:GNAT family N-acetyltransferase [Faecalicatena acetigenes]|jgi:GNAT superfamily N-acetyltransferase|uniref:GNAT family N-acetyltransferase n=1 Tax=Faecalicatena acetigenes TaxID=2981790 RepID=A0ABT2TBE6_9FIRM|nr:MULTISPECIES: GNAT family N-acetyltransferase [Lachnospiraceae]MCU6747039.1 GNAT family N-acetyltransferase [Faecalicatena acetigenes]RGT72312.1 GNAT family N-acetyltransferase [Ruminococcus sp. AF18-22]SCH59882.1 Uncharacterised protein [uncultured Clostridium sp.]